MTETGPEGRIIASRFVGFVVCARAMAGIVSKDEGAPFHPCTLHPNPLA
jgi:hypothetical protein